MKPLLLYQDRDFAFKQELPRHTPAVIQDLEVNTVLRAMAGKDEYLFGIAKAVMFAGENNDAETILYRQEILKDCLKNPTVLRELYLITVTAVEKKSTHWLGIFARYPGGILYEAVELLQWFVDFLRKLRAVADTRASAFESRGFRNLFSMLRTEISDEYLATVQSHLKELRHRAGVVESAELGKGLEGEHYVLHEARGRRPNFLRRLFDKAARDFTFHLPERDEAGARIVSEMCDQGINLIANALAQSSDHIQSFFDVLRAELGFYVGCLNLKEQFAPRGTSICFPVPAPVGSRKLHFRSLRDASLVLTTDKEVVGNDLNADQKNLIIITGANQGGKSSFLRSVGLVQLMMQCGLFVAAESFEGEFSSGLFTHYTREEDTTMKSGKLDEELSRMSGIVDSLVPGSILLFNESFASTNEREGSEIARQIVLALVERDIKVFFVTHLFTFAHRLSAEGRSDILFLRAERSADGTRTFHLVPSDPLETSFGEDLYKKVFSTASA